MFDWSNLILGMLGGGGIATVVVLFRDWRSSHRSSCAEAETLELGNDDVRFRSYVLTINDLNERMASALSRQRELDSELLKSNATIQALKLENERLKYLLAKYNIHYDE